MRRSATTTACWSAAGSGATTRIASPIGPAAGPAVRLLTAELETVTTTGEEAEGEVAVRGRCVFGGYEMREHFDFDPNASAFVEDTSGDDEAGAWLRTGDKGWFDAHGHLHLTGRFKEIINRAGEKISPLTIEHALLASCAAESKGSCRS